ncbi:hypothetical protein FQA39_LY16650 [Lamprigera yunnana]|nr:hypothetical protein FQA39_LY16650 [Lamprigera yunnana]
MRKTNSGNFLVCPLSIDVVLALVHAGARGNTAKQLSTGLHLPECHSEREGYSLNSANKIYLQDNFKISDDFKSVAVNVFNSDIQNVNFKKNEEAANEINKWVEEQTEDKIRDLINKDDLSEDTRAVLVNALYFNGTWVHQFPKYATTQRPFHSTKDKAVNIDMMENTDYFGYYEDDTLKAKFLEMPYIGSDIFMTIVLPNDIEGLAELEDNLPAVLTEPKYTMERVHVQIPKFKIESTIELIPILKQLGIEDLFDDRSDLTGIGANKESLAVSKVVQKAFIEVQEAGTTAAAATAVEIVDRSGSSYYSTTTFWADRPFIFYVRFTNNSVPLFIGRVSSLVS